MKEIPASPLAASGLVMTGADGIRGLTVSARLAVPVPPLLVALKLIVKVPATVGVPEINPFVSVSPAGKGVAPKLVGLLVAVMR